MFRILIVEDMQSFRASLREILDSGFPEVVVEEAVNGKEALEKTDSFHPNLIFMDIRLPDVSGLELTKKIKSQHPGTMIVIFTSFDTPEYRDAAARFGAKDFLVKGTATRRDIQSLVKSFL